MEYKNKYPNCAECPAIAYQQQSRDEHSITLENYELQAITANVEYDELQNALDDMIIENGCTIMSLREAGAGDADIKEQSKHFVVYRAMQNDNTLNYQNYNAHMQKILAIQQKQISLVDEETHDFAHNCPGYSTQVDLGQRACTAYQISGTNKNNPR